ncbi:hypothetical protein KAH27_02675, partial [bacterium]|nr:hypothetical protein [bacterium]
ISHNQFQRSYYDLHASSLRSSILFKEDKSMPHKLFIKPMSRRFPVFYTKANTGRFHDKTTSCVAPAAQIKSDVWFLLTMEFLI